MALTALVVQDSQLDTLVAKASEMVGDFKCARRGPSGPERRALELYLASNTHAIVAAQDPLGTLQGFLVIRKSDAKTIWMVINRARAAEIVGFLAAGILAQYGRRVWGRVEGPAARAAMLSIPGMTAEADNIIRYTG